MEIIVVKPRPRPVAFRISDAEHKYLCEACAEMGVRSVSELVRQAVTHYLETRRSTRSLLTDDLASVATRLEELDMSLNELSKVISRVLGPSRRSRVAAKS
jgi:hypothetical protein